MKKKLWILIAIVLLVVSAFFVYRYLSLPTYKVPFKTEDVKSVRLSNQWEYKFIEDSDEIENLIAELGKIKIVSDFDERKARFEEGGFGCSLYFELADGRQMEYSAARMQGLRFRFVDEKGTAYFAHNFTPGKIWNQLDASIPSNYYFIYYKGKLHEGFATVARVPDDAVLVGTITGVTLTPDRELECSRGKAGENVYVWERNGTTKLAIEVKQDVWPYPQGFVIDIPTSIEGTNDAIPKNWGITLSADNVTPTGLTIVCFHSGGENVSELNTGSYYVLQKLEDKSWVDVEYLPQEHPVGWTQEAWIIEKESTTFWEVDWEWLYGKLAAGEYRIGKEIMKFRSTGDYDEEMLYADFVIE